MTKITIKKDTVRSTKELLSICKKNITQFKKRDTLKYINKPKAIEWTLGDPSFVANISRNKEYDWGRKLVGNHTNQWTTKLGEQLLHDALILKGENPCRVTRPIVGFNGKRMVPDFETDTAFYECKARTFSTTGTAGEKILGTPQKYIELHKITKKPLYIVCMAYQEKEAEKAFNLFGNKSPELQKYLDFIWKEYKIKYVPFSDLLRQSLNKKI